MDDGAIDRGAVWMVDLNSDGTLQSTRELADGISGLDGLHDRDEFGSAITGIGDLDGNGVVDLAVGAPGESLQRGAVWILFRAADGSIASQRALRPGRDGLAAFTERARFGASLAYLGDLDGDGAPELAVGAPSIPEFAVSGELRILSLASDGSAIRELRVARGIGGFGGAIEAHDAFGSALSTIGDFDGNGVMDLAVGSPWHSHPQYREGAVWLLLMNTNGTVASSIKINSGTPGLGTAVFRELGKSVCSLGDLDSDGTVDLAVGAENHFGTGSVWILRLNPDGSAKGFQELRQGIGGFGSTPYERLGASVSALGDLDGDGVPDLAAGANYPPDFYSSHPLSTVFLLALRPDGTVKVRRTIDALLPGHAPFDLLGAGLALLGDIDNDGHVDIAAGASAREGLTDPGSDHSTLQAAIDASATGDTVLLREGSYVRDDPFFATGSVVGKGLTIVGDQSWSADGAERFVEVGDLSVQDLPASQALVLSHLSGKLSANPVVYLGRAAGPVWVEELDGFKLHVVDCSDVVLVRCSSEPWYFPEIEDTPGLYVAGASRVHAYGCVFKGSDGYCESFWGDGDPVPPEPGISLRDSSFLFLSGCTAQGGRGEVCTTCVSGAPGLSARLGTSSAQVLDSHLIGGPSGGCGTGFPFSGPVQLLGGASLGFTSPVAHEGEDAVLSFRGSPGALIWLMGSPFARSEWRATLHGALLVGTPHTLRFMGTMDAAGKLEAVLPLGLLPPTWDVRRLFLQPLMIDTARAGSGGHARGSSSRVTLGAGATLIVLDSSF